MASRRIIKCKVQAEGEVGRGNANEQFVSMDVGMVVRRPPRNTFFVRPNDLLGEGWRKKRLQEYVDRAFFCFWVDKVGTERDTFGEVCGRALVGQVASSLQVFGANLRSE